MDGPWGCYAKWNKPDRERQIQHDFTYMWNFKKRKKHINETKPWLRYREQMFAGRRKFGVSEVDEGDQEAQTSSYKINISHEDKTYNMGNTINNLTLH